MMIHYSRALILRRLLRFFILRTGGHRYDALTDTWIAAQRGNGIAQNGDETECRGRKSMVRLTACQA